LRINLNKSIPLFWTPILTIFLMVSFTGCRHKDIPKAPDNNGVILAEKVQSIAVLRLDAPAFSNLDLQDRTATFYLSQAIIAGRDIATDQLHPRHLEMRKFLENISQEISYGVPDQLSQPFWTGLKLIWINNGFYNPTNLGKIPLPLGEHELTLLMFLALSNSGGRLGSLVDINLKRSWMVDSLFVLSIDRSLYRGDELFRRSATFNSPIRFYQGVTPDEIDSFPYKFPHNSNLIKSEGRIFEQIYRTGDETFSAGPYASELEKVVGNLEKARPYLHPDLVKQVDHLVNYFRTGSTSSFDSARTVGKGTGNIGFTMGFDDFRFDPFGRKGVWSGKLFINDPKAQAEAEQIRSTALKALEPSPFSDYVKLQLTRPALQCVQLLTATGMDAPLCSDILIQPAVEHTQPSALLFTNVINARARSLIEADEKLTTQDQAKVQQARELDPKLAFIEAVLQAHFKSTSISNAKLGNLDEMHWQPLAESTMGELAYLWCMGQGSLQDFLPPGDSKVEAYQRFVKQAALTYNLQDPLGDYSGIGVYRFLTNYFLKQGGSIDIKSDGESDLSRLVSAEIFHSQIGELAAKLSHLIVQPDNTQLVDFIKSYTPLMASGPSVKAPINRKMEQMGDETPSDSTKPEHGRLRRGRNDEPVTSSQTVAEAFIQPIINATINPMGGISGIKLVQPADLTTEMLLFGGVQSSDQNKSKEK
jgi:hypothetical protein